MQLFIITDLLYDKWQFIVQIQDAEWWSYYLSIVAIFCKLYKIIVASILNYPFTISP